MTLIPAVVRDAHSGEILMLAYMNDESLARTGATGEAWFWSRSRNRLWHKGATSGNTMRVVHIATDCDGDSLVVTVRPAGPACHNGTTSCFTDVPQLPLGRLMSILRSRRKDMPEGSYSTYLFAEGREKILKKVGEEATEVVIAAMTGSRQRVISELADLVFHLSVLMVEQGVEWAEVEEELAARSTSTGGDLR